MSDACGDPDVDVVITTRELVRMLRCSMIDPAALGGEQLRFSRSAPVRARR